MSRYRDDRDESFGGGRTRERDRYGTEYYDPARSAYGRRDWEDDYGEYSRERRRQLGERGDWSDYDRYRYSDRGSDRGAYERGDYWRGEYDEGRGGYGRHETLRRGATRSHVRCRDIMTKDVTVATRRTSLREIAEMMRDEDTGVIPVVDFPAATQPGAETAETRAGNGRHNGRLVGLITDRDIVVRAIAEGKDPHTTHAEDVMTQDVHTANPNDRVVDVIRKMGDKQVRRIPVVDSNGNLRGIISMADVALETEEDAELAHALEEISSGSSFWSKIFG
jgi:CBS domain-containing protein